MDVASPNIKQSGAYYTADAVANFLVRWAVRSAKDRVLDPSFGGGVFLRAAARYIETIGGHPSVVHGIEIDNEPFREVRRRFCPPLEKAALVNADFFEIESPKNGAAYDAIVGNPPFVRYQSFTGRARDRALARSLDRGVKLPKLASSWAPFVVHSVAMLRPEGRLAFVLPMEAFHAAYGRPVLNHLRNHFGTLYILTFRHRLFPDLSQDCVLLLADGYGLHPKRRAKLCWRDLPGPGALADLDPDAVIIPRSRRLDANAFDHGRRLTEHFVPKASRNLYRELVMHPGVRRLGDVARVGIGYVSGNNDFFHLSTVEAERRGIPKDFLRPAVRKGRNLAGLRFTSDDWNSAEATYLLEVPRPLLNGSVPKTLRKYLDEGEVSGVHRAYKCRVRTPWYSVPHVQQADAFLTYMSGKIPRFVTNEAEVVAPNNLHVVRLRNDAPCTVGAIAAAWPSALTRLSVELEGHAMGGGMLKLEPREAERVALPPLPGNERLDLIELDELARRGETEALADRVDQALLIDGLGLSRADCRRLRSAAKTLMERRYAAGRVARL